MKARMDRNAIVAAALGATALILFTYNAQATHRTPVSLQYTKLTGDRPLMFSSAHWDSIDLPQDSSRKQMLFADSGLSSDGNFNAAHFDSTRLPEDTTGSSSRSAQSKLSSLFSAKSQGVSRTMAGEIADNGAAILRKTSFRTVIDDCKQKSNCQNLIGKRLWNVISSANNEPNLKIMHDYDDERKKQELKIERDYTKDYHKKYIADNSAQNWEKLQDMMSQTQASGYDSKAAKEIQQIKKENIPEDEKRILLDQIERQGKVQMQAMNLNHGYKSETSLIFGGDHSKTMRPTQKDQEDELSEARKIISRPSEAQVLQKYQTKAIHSLNDKKAGQSHKESQEEVRTWTENASEIRKEMNDRDKQGSSANSGRASLDSRSDSYEQSDAESRTRLERKEANAELKSYDIPVDSATETHSHRDVLVDANLDDARTTRPAESMQVSTKPMSVEGQDCFLSGGRKVKCSEIVRLGKLMRKVYGKKASDIALVARDKSWDPTKVFNKEGEALQEQRPKEGAKQQLARNSLPRRSEMGKQIHEMNVAEAPASHLKRRTDGLGSLSKSLANVIGW
mmetsp:Transcript_24098/g.54087  ORF Transcript_24098/g.54087 Transcript_24098/m.54087 type:complete len:566 (-) Transcript_24098:93-1790(-)